MSEINYKLAAEVAVIRRLITEVYPTGICSLVADSYDFWSVITKAAPLLKDEIMARQPNALGLNKVVFRPDSGDPVKILTGYTESEIASVVPKSESGLENICVTVDGLEITEAERKGAVECLWDIFGGTETEKGYKMLDEHVGLIYGDSITLERANLILKRLADKGFAASNVVFGIGSYTYQYITRDTFGFAMKATYGEVYGEGREIFKDPATDSGVKKSAKGLLRVEKEGDDFVLYDQQTKQEEQQGELQTVFRNGLLHRFQTLQEIRDNLRNS